MSRLNLFFNEVEAMRNLGERGALVVLVTAGFLLTSGLACEPSPDGSTGDTGADGDVGFRSDADVTEDTRDAAERDADVAVEDSDAGTPVGPLAGLPSDEGEHLGAIADLEAGEWLELPTPAGDPEFGTARGRSWGGRAFALAPSLRGAFFTGEGRHAYVKPNGYAMDDVWFYDINANRWIAVYPGTNTNTFNEQVASGELYVDERGQISKKDGGLVPIHVLIHAWDYLTYDTDRGRFAFLAGAGMGRYYLPGEEAIDEGVTELQRQREDRPPVPMSPWYYDPSEGTFTREPAENGSPDVGGFPAFVYVPPLDGFLKLGSKGVARYDPEQNAWSRVEDSGPQPPRYDHGVCYDPVRNRVYMGPGDGSGGIYIFDVASREWTKQDLENGPPNFRTNVASVFYDAANDVITVFRYADYTVYVYHPDEKRWISESMPESVVDSVSHPQHHAFYDAQLNAYFLYVAGDSRDNGRMWVYRYQ